VASLVDDVLMPPLGRLLGHVDFSSKFINLSDKTYENAGGGESGGGTDAELRQLYQYNYQFCDRGVCNFYRGESGESLDGENRRRRLRRRRRIVRNARWRFRWRRSGAGIAQRRFRKQRREEVKTRRKERAQARNDFAKHGHDISCPCKNRTREEQDKKGRLEALPGQADVTNKIKSAA